MGVSRWLILAGLVLVPLLGTAGPVACACLPSQGPFLAAASARYAALWNTPVPPGHPLLASRGGAPSRGTGVAEEEPHASGHVAPVPARLRLGSCGARSVCPPPSERLGFGASDLPPPAGAHTLE